MKKILCMLLILCCTGCSTEKKPTDVWIATIQAIEASLENNGYNEGAWQIGVEDADNASNKEHRNITIRQVYEDEESAKVILFALQNNKNKESIVYRYEVVKEEDGNTYTESLDVRSIDEAFKEYEITYSFVEAHNGNYFDESSATGKLRVENGEVIIEDTLPLLKEAMQNCEALLQDYEREFGMKFSDYDFINVPALVNASKISDPDDIAQDTATSSEYYAMPYSNAKGYSIVSFLKVDKAYTSAQFGAYVKEQEAFASNLNVPLEKRTEACYNLVQTDPDIAYAVYFSGDSAYLYAQSESNEFIEQDVLQGATNALMILKTTNQPYDA